MSTFTSIVSTLLIAQHLVDKVRGGYNFTRKKRGVKLMIWLILFTTIIPEILGIIDVAFIIFSIHYTITGQEIVPIICRFTDWLNNSSWEGTPLVGLIVMGLIFIYVVVAGLVNLSNLKAVVGDPENSYIEFSVKEIYSGHYSISASEGSAFSITQLFKLLWNYVLLPIIGLIVILAFGWLTFIIQTIIYYRHN